MYIYTQFNIPTIPLLAIYLPYQLSPSVFPPGGRPPIQTFCEGSMALSFAMSSWGFMDY